ncbi:MAG: hypothetical protein ACFFBP_21260 [Promethearchaeota archaeon]
MKAILNEEDVYFFLTEIERNFPNFVAGVITDNHGFPIASKIPINFHFNETELALSAISDERDFINDSRFVKVIRNLDEKNSIKLFFLLLKRNGYVNRFRKLKEIIERQNLF